MLSFESLRSNVQPFTMLTMKKAFLVVAVLLTACNPSGNNAPNQGGPGADGGPGLDGGPGSDGGPGTDGGSPTGEGGIAPGFVGLFPDKPAPGQHQIAGSVKVDAQGGIHVAYMGSGPPAPVRYGYCASQCGQGASWTFIDAADGGDGLGKVLILLDPQGHPRIGYYKTNAQGAGVYAYASCDSGCTSAGGWTTALLGTGSTVSNFDSADHFFALDPQGNPGMLYFDTTGAHTGLFYASCAGANCKSAASWQELQVSTTYSFLEFALVYDAQARPRFLYEAPDMNGNEFLGYVECNGGCSNAASWASVVLSPLGAGSAFALGVNSQGQPRIAMYTGATADPSKAKQLVYGYCNAATCSTAASWSAYPIGTDPSDGANGLDLAFNAKGLPVVAFFTGGQLSPTDGVAVAVCDAGCESASPSWRRAQAFLDPAMDTANPIPAAANCTTAFWQSKNRVTLALDSAGNLAITADAGHLQGGGSCTTITTDTDGVFLGLLPSF
jgi:hypothetical protein